MQEVSCNLHTSICVSCYRGDALHVCRCTPKLVRLLLTPTEWVWHQHISYTLSCEHNIVQSVSLYYYMYNYSKLPSCLHSTNDFPGGRLLYSILLWVLFYGRSACIAGKLVWAALHAADIDSGGHSSCL